MTETASIESIEKEEVKPVAHKWDAWTGARAEIVWHANKAGLHEAFSSGMQFCLVDDANNQCSPWMHCKDYIQDAIHGRMNNTSASIYGFSYNPKQAHHPSIKNARLLIANVDDNEFFEKVPALMDFIHQIEEELKIPGSKVALCVNPPAKYSRGGAFLVIGSKRWIRSSVMISMYTLLVRVGLGHAVGKSFRVTLEAAKSGKTYCSADAGHVRCGLAGIERILKEGDLAIFGRKMRANYPKDWDVDSIHNYSGIVAFTNGSTKNKFPRWHGMPEKKVKKKKEK